MAERAHSGPLAFPLQENPLRERRVIFRRYGRNALIAVLLSMMAYHIIVVETDWVRMGGIREIISTAAEFWPNPAFIPIIIDPLLETLLIAFWGTVLATVLAMPVAYICARNTSPFYPVVYLFGRSIIVLSRSTHEFIFALILTATPKAQPPQKHNHPTSIATPKARISCLGSDKWERGSPCTYVRM